MCAIRILENVKWKWTGIIQARLNNADRQRKGGKVWKEAVAEGKKLRKTERKWDRDTGGNDSWRRGKRESLCGRGRWQRTFLYWIGFLLPPMKYTTLIYSWASWCVRSLHPCLLSSLACPERTELKDRMLDLQTSCGSKNKKVKTLRETVKLRKVSYMCVGTGNAVV